MRAASRVGLAIAIAAAGFGTAMSAEAQNRPGQRPVVPVEVINTALEVHVAKNRTPVQLYTSRSDCPAGSCFIEMMVVPDGKRLVIQHVGLRGQMLPTGSGNRATAIIQTRFDDSLEQQIPIGTTTNTGSGINSADVFAGEVTLYAQSGTVVYCAGLVPNLERWSYLVCAITGHLEDEG